MGFSATHAFISWEYLDDFYFDSVFINIPKTDGLIDYSDLAPAYSELKQKVAEVCVNAPGDDKELYIASLIQKTETNNVLTVKAEVTIGSKSTPPDNRPFSIGWLYGDVLGDCNGNPISVGYDACTELRDKTNQYRYLYVNDEQMVYIGIPNEEPYVTIRSEDQAFLNTNDPIPGDNYYEHLLVYQKQIWSYHDCIHESEMNWYYHKLNYVIYNKVPNSLQLWPNAYRKTFIQVMIDSDPVYGTYGTKDVYFIRHQYKLEYRYGIYIGNVSEPESIVEE